MLKGPAFRKGLVSLQLGPNFFDANTMLRQEAGSISITAALRKGQPLLPWSKRRLMGGIGIPMPTMLN